MGVETQSQARIRFSISFVMAAETEDHKTVPRENFIFALGASALAGTPVLSSIPEPLILFQQTSFSAYPTLPLRQKQIYKRQFFYMAGF